MVCLYTHSRLHPSSCLEFFINHIGGGVVTLKAVKAGGGVGVFENGQPKPPMAVGDGPHGQFQIVYA